MLRLDTSSPADQGAMLLLLLALVDADSLLDCGASRVDLLGTLILCTTAKCKQIQQQHQTFAIIALYRALTIASVWTFHS